MYSTNCRLPQTIPFLIAKVMVTPSTGRGWEHGLFEWIFPGEAVIEHGSLMASCFSSLQTQRLVCSAGSSCSWKCLWSRRENQDLPAYLEKDMWLGLCSPDSRWELLQQTNSSNFCSSWWHERFQCALKRNWYRESTQAVTEGQWTLE